MSADNYIIVLGTKSAWKRVGNTVYKVPERKVYRVAHVQAWDNLKWLEENQPYNVGAYLYETFKDCIIHEDIEKALRFAKTMEKFVGYLEYGINVVETDYTLYGD